MADGKLVKDVMIGIFEYPHIPYWFTINQAVRIIKVSFISSKKYPEPMAILVFDEKYNLMGTLTLKDILRGLEPRFMQSHRARHRCYKRTRADLSLIWDTLFSQRSQKSLPRSRSAR